jgi:excisionase family DNA binding protein
MTKLYTKSEVARMFRVSRMTVYRWVRLGILSGRRVGKRGDWRISQDDIDAMLQRVNKEGNE